MKALILATRFLPVFVSLCFLGNLGPVLPPCSLLAASEPESTSWFVGASKVDITPDEPVRLSGYASRLVPRTACPPELWSSLRGPRPTMHS